MRLVALVLDFHDEVSCLLDLPLKSVLIGADLLNGRAELSFLGLVTLCEFVNFTLVLVSHLAYFSLILVC